MKFFIILSFVFSTLFANTNFYEKMLNEDEPSIFFNSVNVITGNYYHDFEITVNSIEPIIINPSYINLSYMDSRLIDQYNYEEYLFAGWKYFDYLKAFLYRDRLDITLKNGTILTFNPPNVKTINKGFFESKKAKKKRKEKEEIERNRVRALNFVKKNHQPYYFNLENNKILDYSKIKVEFIGHDTIKVIFPNDTQKAYERSIENNVFLLSYEITINKNKISYFYDKYNNLTEIRSSNFKGNLTYGYAKFSYSYPDPLSKNIKERKDFIITTSDGNKYEFKHGT